MDWVTGDKFKSLGDFTFSPHIRYRDDYDGLINTFNPDGVLDECIIYTHTFYAKQLFEQIKKIDKGVILVTHNSDLNVDDSFKIPDNIIKWFTQNVNYKDNKLESIPIGLENDRWFKGLRKKDKMLIKLSQPKHFKNWIYMNHNIDTNPDKRKEVYDLLRDKPWVTVERGYNGHGFDEYLNDVYNHNFVICPEGNGMDTHRTWETLYMGTIPIEKRNINNQFYTDLPICFVNDWEEVTLDFLEREYFRIKSTEWNMNKLTFDYWKIKILNERN